MALSFTDVQKATAEARAKAQQLGINIAVVVVDARGDLVAVERMDGARWFTADVARGKAFLSATFGRPSADIAENADNPFFRSMLAHFEGKIVFAQGAVPIVQDGILVGAIGVSGGTGEQDAECAAAGVATI